MAQPNTTPKPAKRGRKMARQPQTEPKLVQRSDHSSGTNPVMPSAAVPPPAAAKARMPTKADLILGLLRREEGATLTDLVTATGWLPHTTRAALTGVKRKGHVLSSEKVGGVRRYRVANSAGNP